MRLPAKLAISVVLGGLAGMGAAQLYYSGLVGAKPEQIQPIGAKIGGPFSLMGEDGRMIADTDFLGRMMLVYFGYTYCPDVCPTDLAEMSAAIDDLGPDADKVTPIFITVDPERDTPDVMAAYTQMFNPRIVGLTGTPAAIDGVRKLYGVYASKVDEKEPGDYLVDHTAWTYLMDETGKFILPIRHGTPAAEIAALIRKHAKK